MYLLTYHTISLNFYKYSCMIDTHDRVLKTHQLINGSKAVDEFKRLCTVCCFNLATAFIKVRFCNYSIFFSMFKPPFVWSSTNVCLFIWYWSCNLIVTLARWATQHLLESVFAKFICYESGLKNYELLILTTISSYKRWSYLKLNSKTLKLSPLPFVFTIYKHPFYEFVLLIY